jgi:ribosomal L7/L12-like protein
MNVTITDYEQGRRIAVIKVVRALTGYGLRESKAIVDSIDGKGSNAGENGLKIGPQTIRTSASLADVAAAFSGVASYTVEQQVDMATSQLAINAVQAFGDRACAREGLRTLVATLDPTLDVVEALNAALGVL